MFCVEKTNLVVAELFQNLQYVFHVRHPQRKSGPRIKKGGQPVQVEVPISLSKVHSHLSTEVAVERHGVRRETV